MQQQILIAVDSLIFTVIKGKLHILLIKRLIEPYKDMRAIPGGFVLDGESLEQAAKRELEEEANITNTYMEQLYTFGNLGRDPRGRVISCAYIALMNNETMKPVAGSDASQAQLFSINELPSLAFDHNMIVSYALERLRAKIMYTDIAKFLLPKQFTLRQLQDSYESILGQSLDIRNFRKKILKADIIKSTGLLKKQGVSRPAELFEFVQMDDTYSLLQF